MRGDMASSNNTEWTWADLVSTYRFWGLLLFYCLSSTATFASFAFLPVYLAERFNLSLIQISYLFIWRNLGFFLGGFFLAWAVGRRRSVNWLLFVGAIQLFGVLLLSIPSLPASPVFPQAGALLLGVGASGVLVGIAALLAGGRGSTESFAIAFGLLFGASELMRLLSSSLKGLIENRWGFSGIAAAGVVLLVLALIALAPIDRSLFAGTPPQRGKCIVPRRRNPALVAVLGAFLPFYFLYWLYKAHGEVASLIPSRALMSPRGAVGLALLPFLVPVMMTTLTDQLNKRATGQGADKFSRPWVTFLWSMILFPVAMGLLQSRINTSASLQRQGASAQ